MCGINGIVFKKNEPDISKIINMNQLLHHRGPDSSGYKKFECLLLGHTRLSIMDLSEKMIHLSGLIPIDNENPDGDIRIEYTGLRPGEKLYEELLIGTDVIQSEHPRIMQAIESKLDMNTVLSCIKIIKEARDPQDDRIIKQLLLKHVDGYTSQVS